MFSAYYFLYATLAVLLLAYIPAIIAAGKERSFSRWYVYGVILFPIALAHSLILKKPVHRINIFIHDKNNPSKRRKKTYLEVPKAKRNITISPKYVYIVFFSKLIFGAFVAFSVYAVFRTMVSGTESLRRACVIFAILFSVMLSIVELCRYSRFPMVADEITKRALITVAYSVACSLPLFLLKVYVIDLLLPDKYSDLAMFLFAIASFGIFLALLLRRQRIYYSAFNGFLDYCVLSICAYVMFAAVSLVWMSIADLRGLVFAVAMPTQIFNMEYLSGVEVIGRLPYIYSSAFVHLVVAVMIFFSGLLCKSYKRKELEFRIEYRSKAFRMSRKIALHRRIPKMETVGIK